MSDEKERLGSFPFVLGGMSFIPMVGVVFGIVSIGWGLFSKRKGGKKLALIGLGGILFTVLLYFGLFLFGLVMRGEGGSFLKKIFPSMALNSLVHAVEVYKDQHGEYPESLEALMQLAPENSSFTVLVSKGGVLGGSSQYYYEVVDADHYYLLDMGKDGKPFTFDDIFPNEQLSRQGRTGLMKKNNLN
ncbi:Uncharacterised protein [Zhongshania aliphaticivorans]|uniref:Type II secretion system protein GspG C-terminal domain-containing protein n=1 Tax=Zhongshania aliphaticivorans TaxID=1470434 RepID=A0A5S9MXL4_9GAMM|nr:type II secretion system protein G [Zhongshania aliphaticivorans]CAA0082073.1 Uncharacterised protein [Zhongshania aliphaticivorans]CAA0084593.1 Uncharacterised protein [Zhongshania aliphaticivorans]